MPGVLGTGALGGETLSRGPAWARRRVSAPINDGFYGRAHRGGRLRPTSVS
jgi:hypothetical protein